uniref:BTB domain-containing protein n=1 Tax=Panagrolaimus davidi TaxID=227884 RepID=A0A914P678_9BILA
MEMITSDHPSYWRYNRSQSINAEEKPVLSREDKIKNNIYKLQQEKLKLFELQNPEIGHFDVIFDFDGKLLYANKYVLVTSSETLNSWLSNRWTKDENPIKMETYTFDIFYQFCSFLYSANCKLTNENIFQIVDAAEFFGIQLLKDFCEEFLIEIFNENNIGEIYKIAETYLLSNLLKEIERYVNQNYKTLIMEEKIVNLPKSLVMMTCKYHGGEFSVFEAVYKWTENYVKIKKEDLEFEEKCNYEFSEFLPVLFVPEFDANKVFSFLVEKPFLVSVSQLPKIIPNYNGKRIEKLFKTVSFHCRNLRDDACD